MHSPSTTDKAGGSCLPRMAGIARTIAVFERVFMDGFAEGRRRLICAHEQAWISGKICIQTYRPYPSLSTTTTAPPSSP